MIKKLFICPYFGTLPSWFDSYLANIELLKPLGYDWHVTTNLKLFRERVGDILGIQCPIVPGTGKVWDYRPALGVLFAEEVKGYDYWGHTDFDCVYGRVDRFVGDEFLCWRSEPVESREGSAVGPRNDLQCERCGTAYDGLKYLGYFCRKCGGMIVFSNLFGERPENTPLPERAVSPNQKPLDIHSNHHNYICGPWTLYRNVNRINNLFLLYKDWRKMLEGPEPTAWVETEFTALVDWAATGKGGGSSEFRTSAVEDPNVPIITRKYTHWQEQNPRDTSGITMAEDGTLRDRAWAEKECEIMMCHFRHTKEYPKGVKFV